MAVAHGQYNDQATMDALATLANARLLPLVNAAIAAGHWPTSNAYDQFTAGVLNNPQTAYVFAVGASNWMTELNRIRGDFWILVFGTYGASVPINADLYKNPDAVLSGPWVVGVNDPDTFGKVTPADTMTQAQLDAIMKGILSGVLNNGPVTFCPFKNLSYVFAAEDAPDGFSISKNNIINNGAGAFHPVALPAGGERHTADIVTDVDGTVTVDVMVGWFYSGTQPTIDDFTLAAAPDTGVTWYLVPIIFEGNRPGVIVHFHLVTHYAAGTNHVQFDITPPANATNFAAGADNSFTASFQTDGVSATAGAQVIHPSKTGAVIVLPDLAQQLFSVQTVLADDVTWSISDTDVKGVWIANTLPAPGNNVFLDQDLPPFVGALQYQIGLNNFIAVAGNLLVDQNVPLASTMRQAAPIELDPATGASFVTSDPKVNPVQPEITCRPAKWQVLRDSDFVKYDFGYASESIVINTWVSPKDGIGYFSQAVPLGYGSSWYGVKIRLVKGGTGAPGWKNGVFQYGEALPAGLRIFVSATDDPDPNDPSTYDFFTDNNAVSIPSDGGPGYPAMIDGSGFNYAIQNNTGQEVRFDLVTEIDTTAAAVRNYFPPAGTAECFSYVVDGTPPYPKGPNFDYGAYPKLIPQSGYCIFKVRATRPAVDNGAGQAVTPMSGAQIVVTLGQNKLQVDGTLAFAPLMEVDGVTPFTVTIAANARDSGDVAVFWPVLGGNEVVWQGASEIVLEAWANWQPVFFNSYFGLGNFHGYFNTYQATAFPCALRMQNFYDITRSNYPRTVNDRTTTVQFPMFAELYNDLEASLNLI